MVRIDILREYSWACLGGLLSITLDTLDDGRMNGWTDNGWTDGWMNARSDGMGKGGMAPLLYNVSDANQGAKKGARIKQPEGETVESVLETSGLGCHFRGRARES